MTRYVCDPEAVIRELQLFADEGDVVNARIFIQFSAEITAEHLATIGLDDPDRLARLHDLVAQRGQPFGFIGDDRQGRRLARGLEQYKAAPEVRDSLVDLLEGLRESAIAEGRNPGPVQTLPGGWIFYKHNDDPKEGA